MRAFLPLLINALGDVSYRPLPGDMASKPTPGKFYQVKKNDTVWKIARIAYNAPRPGIFWINDAAWNGRIRKGKAGWTSYGVKGIQLTKDYDPANAPSQYGSGKQYPIIWIPATKGDEPQAAPAATPPPVTQPAEPCPPCPPPKIVEKIVEVPGPERVVEVPGPERVVEVPGPERVVEVPGPPKIIEKIVEVPGPERVVEVPGPERVVEVPGPERVVEVPGPERVVEVPGPPKIVEKIVEVPGPERVVKVPGPERVVEVPGPERVVERVVEVPGPPQIIEREIPGTAGPKWSTAQSVSFWGLLVGGLVSMKGSG